VSIDIRGRRDTVLLAMAAHPEYDDRYWRFVRDVRVEGAGGRASVSKADSAVWRVVAPGGSFTLRYRLVLRRVTRGSGPPGSRSSRPQVDSSAESIRSCMSS